MKKRRALLIGVPEYESDAIDDLPIVRRDIETLHSSLEKSGFSVRSVGTDGMSQTGRSKVLQALRRECKEAQGVETLLLYFSGHGMHYRGKDYLIPSDAVLDDAEFVEEYLVPTDFGDIIDQSGAETVIFFVDACREGVKLDFKASYLAGWSRGERRQALRRSFVLAFACGPGQVSQYVGGEEGFSLFSKALAEVLDPQHHACTLKEVLDETQVKLNALVAEHGKQPQKIYCAYESAVEDDTSLRVICDGVTTADVRGKASDPWSEAALQSSLWKAEGTDENCPVVQLKQQVAKVLAACWQQWQAAIRAFPQDPWRDEQLSIRVLESLELLVFRSDPPVELTVAETALAVAVPFVREAVLASNVVQAAKANPLSWEETSPKTGFGIELDKVHQAQLRFVRKAKRLKEQGGIADKDAVMAWLMHYCLLRKTLKVWEPESSGGYLSNDFTRAVDNASCCKSRLVKETLARKRLLELARCMYADYERIDRDDDPNALQSRLIVGRYREEQEIREKMLAYLLKLAGLLAIDVRTLSDVLVDHIGLANPLTPGNIIHTVNQARWEPSGGGRTLRVICHHPAADRVLHEHVEQTSSVLVHIFKQIIEKRGGMETLAGLPTHLMPDGITPEQQDGVPMYQKPHVNFQLAHDEVRELLMGEQLYGDPGLAIRELYQNALDACRYREARLKYLKQTGQYQEPNQQWEGQIIFRQGKDRDGRDYIECEDNGIGMAGLHLSQCFAKAGRRFADLPEFIEEQAEWLRCDPPIKLYPNSQFGVGVLSYFMLADEIEVETCRLERKGQPGERLRVHIPGSSGLFRVRGLGIGRDGGTRVRLYLNRTRHEGKLISCIETLRQLVWVAEFPTEVQQGARREVWEVGRLRHPNISENQCLPAGENVWWVERSGCILADGLRTEESQPGIVVNLRQDYYPKLTVDRKKIVEWDRRFVRELLIQNSKPLLNWSYLTLEWLWSLSKKHPHVAAHIVELLSQQQAKVQLGRWSVKNIEVSIAEVGCFEFENILQYMSSEIRSWQYNIPWWIIPHRIALWGKYGLLKLSTACLESIPAWMQAEFCPVPEPRDAVVLSWNFGKRSITEHVQIPPAYIVLAAANLEEPIAVTLKRLQRFVPLGLEVPEVNPDSLGELTASEEDLIALSIQLEEKKKIPWDKKRMPPAQVVLASARLNEPVAETLKRLQKFTHLGLEVPEVEPESLGDLSATPEDLIALSTSLDGQYPYEGDRISIAQVILAANRLNEPIAEALKRLQKFVPLGLEVPEIDSESLDNLTVTKEDLIVLSISLDGKSALNKDQVPPAHIVLAADKLKESITQTIKRLERFVPLGLEIPQVDFDALENLTPTPEDLTVLSENLYRSQALREKQVSPAHVIMAAVKLKESVSETIKRLQRFAPLGLEVPDIDADLESLQEFIADEKNLIVLSENLDGELPLLEGNVHPARVVIAACALNEPVPVTFERMYRFATLFGITLPEGEPNSWKIATSKSNEITDLEY